MARKKRGGKSSQKAKFRKAAKACKGRKIKAFRACMRQHLKR